MFLHALSLHFERDTSSDNFTKGHPFLNSFIMNAVFFAVLSVVSLLGLSGINAYGYGYYYPAPVYAPQVSHGAGNYGFGQDLTILLILILLFSSSTTNTSGK